MKLKLLIKMRTEQEIVKVMGTEIKEGDVVKIETQDETTFGIIEVVAGGLITFFSFYTTDDEAIDLQKNTAKITPANKIELEVFISKRLVSLRKKLREKRRLLEKNSFPNRKVEFIFKIDHYETQIQQIIVKKREVFPDRFAK